MFAYVARQPIFDANRDVFAYELLFRNGEDNCFPDIPPDEATSKILTATHLSHGIDEIIGNKTAFINFHRDTLMYRFPTSLDASNVVIEVVETVTIDDALVSACKHIRGLGYPIALDDYDLSGRWEPFLPFTSVIKLDITEVDHGQIADIIPIVKQRGVKVVVEKIETYEQFNQFKAYGADYFQGYFLAKPEIIRHRQLGPTAMTMLELIRASASAQFNVNDVNRIIERDPSLSYLLLRFINNPLFNKRQQISSLKHALTYMGEVEVKKFIALLALANLSEGKPNELLQMALVRAKFCELITVALKQAENPPTGFLTGLLSLLDAMMEQSMRELMQKVPVSESVKQALRGERNLLRDCLDVATHFESANWAAIQRFAKKYNIKQTLLHGFYNEAIKWGRHMNASAMEKRT